MLNAHAKVEPTNIIALLEQLNADYDAAAKEMGVHPSTLRRAVAEKVTTFKQEKAAEAALQRVREAAEIAYRAEVEALERAQQQAFEPTPIIALVPPAKLESFSKVANLMGVTLETL